MEKKLLVVNTKLSHEELFDKVKNYDDLDIVESISYPFEGDTDSFRLFLYEEINAYLTDYGKSISYPVNAKQLTEQIAQRSYKEISEIIKRLVQEKTAQYPEKNHKNH